MIAAFSKFADCLVKLGTSLFENLYFPIVHVRDSPLQDGDDPVLLEVSN